MWWYFGNWWWVMVLMMFLMVVFWGGIIWLIVWAILRSTRSQGTNLSNPQNPLNVAKERYARGEITKEQYEQIKRDLS